MNILHRLVSFVTARLPGSLLAIFSSARAQVIPIASVTVATVANNLLAFVINIVVARKLGVEGFGVFSLAHSVAMLVGVVGDLGFNLGMIRLFNKYQAESQKQINVIGAALGFKVLLFIVVVVMSFPFGSALAGYIGLNSISQDLFTVALLTGGLLFFWSYLQSYLQAHRSFKELTIFIFAYFGLRLLCLLMAYIFFPRNPLPWLVATYTAPLIILLIVGVVPRGHKPIEAVLMQPKASVDALKELLGYSKWVALSVIAYTVMPYVVQFILAKCASIAEVGIFSAGMTFTVAFSTVNTAVRAVLFPQVTAFEGHQMRRYLARLGRVAPYYAVFAVLGITTLALLQWFVLGEEYRKALPVFVITATAFAISLPISWATMLLHTLERPDIDSIIDVLRVVVLVVFGFIVAGSFKALGIAIVYGSLISFGGVWKLIWIVRKLGGRAHVRD